jgi:NTP pyrophosphatase (non-canonical NTP hydrolase)
LDERDWRFDKSNARGLPISISLEAAELLEHYQWNDKPVGDEAELASELADIFIYGFEFAQVYDINIAEAIEQKLEKQSKKYPKETFNAENNDREAWVKAKIAYNKRKDSL